VEWSPSGERVQITDFDADILYVYRPLDELPHLIELGKRHGVRAVWRDPAPGSADFRAIVEAAGLVYVDERDIAAAL
jgi:predicted CoA-binding protein